MPELAHLILLAMTVLLVKHTIADFFLQNGFQHANKGRYAHPGGLLHAAIHVALTLPVFVILPASPELMIVILAGEFLLHYHVDWLKARITKGRGWLPTQAVFWYAFGTDQLIHLLTYVTIVAILAQHQIAPLELGIWAPWPLRG